MLVIGLTGGIACGKSTAAAALSALGAPIFDADAISRALTSAGGEASGEVLARFGTLDRRSIARAVFSDPAALADLNAIVHPRVRRALGQFLLENAAQPAVVLDIPLLYECGMERYAHAVWVTHVPQEEQIRRLRARDGLSREEALARIAAQMPLEEKMRRANECIDTSGPQEVTRAHIAALWQAALKRAGDARC